MKKQYQWGLALLALLVAVCAFAAAESAVTIRPATLSTMTPATGEKIEATINATNAYAYNFWLFDATGTIVQEKTNTTETKWEFTVNTPGIYLLRTYATNFETEGHADTDWFAVTAAQKPGVTVSNVKVSGTLETGAALTASATVTNALAYNYWLFNDQGTIVKEHTNTTDTSWSLTIEDEGVYLMRIYATNFESETYADSEWFYVQAAKPNVPAVVVSAVDLPTLNYTVGETLHIEAPVSGGSGIFALNYWVFDSTGTIVMEKTNTLDLTADFKLTEPGIYLARVYATDFITEAHNDSQWFGVEKVPVEEINYTYTIQDGYVTITGYTGPSDADLVIPAEIEGLPVTAIGDRAFYQRTDLKGGLALPDSVTSIGKEAFYYGWSLTGGLTLPDNLISIGDKAFYGCSRLTGDLIIPDSVTTIGETAFGVCGGFNGRLILSDNLTSLGEYAFSSCKGLTGGLTIPDSLATISNGAFMGCSGLMGSLTIPEGVTGIGAYAFEDCGFTGSLIIPDSVTSIGIHAFTDCHGFTGDLTIPGRMTNIEMRAFSGCSGLDGTLTLPASLTHIGLQPFEKCAFSRYCAPAGSYAEQWLKKNGYTVTTDETPEDVFSYTVKDGAATITGYKGSLKIDVELPSTLGGFPVRAIGDSAFKGQTKLMGNLTIPDGVVSIGNSAFYGCNLFVNSLSIPDSVTSIGSYAFYGCSGFTGSLTIPGSVESVGPYAFAGCSGFVGLDVLNGVTGIEEYAFYGCSGFTGDLTIPDSMKVIWECAFYGCSGFDGSLTLPDSLTFIGHWAFQGCSFAEYRAPFGSYAARWLRENGFTVTTIMPTGSPTPELTETPTPSPTPEPTAELTEEPIDYTYTIQDDYVIITGYTGPADADLVIPSTVKGLPVRAVGDAAFENRYELTGTLTIPSGVTSIGENAFYNCWELSGSLTLPEGLTTIANGAFYDCMGFAGVLTIPDSVTSIGYNAFYHCIGFNGELIIPDSVTSIGYNAFALCSGLSGSLIIPDGLTSIEPFAFYGCDGLTGSLTIPGGVTSIGSYAFYRCNGFTGNLTIPDGVTTIEDKAFMLCYGLNGTLTLSANVTKIGDSAFESCSFTEYRAPAGSYAAEWLKEQGFDVTEY